jgi:rod shape-determining protein MreD
LSGLFLDVLRGMVLGQHALGFLVVGFLTHRIQLRMRMFPIVHQAATVLVLLAFYHFHHLLDRRPDGPRLHGLGALAADHSGACSGR